MADAQDLKIKNWPFLPFSFLFSLYNVHIVFIGQNSLFACSYVYWATFQRPKVAQKVAQQLANLRMKFQILAAMKWHTVAQIFLSAYFRYTRWEFCELERILPPQRDVEIRQWRLG